MLKAENAVLVIVDVQGTLASLMHNRDELYNNLQKIVRGAQVLDIPIIWNEQLPDKLGKTIPQLSELLEGLNPIEKNCFSCYGNTEFVEQLKETGCKDVLLTGIEAHVCVYQTAIDLLEKSYNVHLVTDAISSRSESNLNLAIDKIKDNGAQLTSVEMSLFEMLTVAEGDNFRKIIKIVK